MTIGSLRLILNNNGGVEVEVDNRPMMFTSLSDN